MDDIQPGSLWVSGRVTARVLEVDETQQRPIAVRFVAGLQGASIYARDEFLRQFVPVSQDSQG
jgi:hypothetical protein